MYDLCMFICYLVFIPQFRKAAFTPFFRYLKLYLIFYIGTYFDITVVTIEDFLEVSLYSIKLFYKLF
jgi:hypothetical protein